MNLFGKSRPRLIRSETAQGLVEFALAFPIFLLLVFGIIEFGRLLMTYSAVYTAAREAARYGAAVGETSNTLYKDCNGIKDAAVRVGFLGGVTPGQVIIQYYDSPYGDWDTTDIDQCNLWIPADSDDPVVGIGDQIAVKVTTQFQPIVPLVNLPSFPITSTASRTIVKDVDIFDVVPTGPPPNCSLISISKQYSGDVYIYSMNINNAGSDNITLENVAIIWSKNNPLQNLLLNGVNIYTGSDPSPVNINSFSSPPVIPPGSMNFKIIFKNNNNPQVSKVTISFTNGCLKQILY